MMDDPILTAVATALATGAAAEVTAGGKAAFAALVRLVRRKAAEQPATGNALDAAQREPLDGQRIAELRAALTTATLNDQVFAAELHRLWAEVRAARTADDHSRASNTISGPVRGPAVQARDIHGGVHFGPGG
ncbi:hypothetical protein O7608_18305 [Solwaraspora sp. WMMA2056]|uniref:hypothetical protein n=2 Tax=unclassified Solwaraspora TaxID=2627926 RepID=UPI00259B3075|nr:hypothetical protein [Solwaraspora sp. WMMA2056]WJK38456.1 hypothetical protein O7608_18305 [Solwaraspora sp. WMMA2056]